MAASPQTIREQVTNRIRDALVVGDFRPGQPLREAEVARNLGVSRGPVRDAFLALTREGLLAYRANRGVTVRRPPAPEDRAFIANLRRRIEAFVVGRGLAKARAAGLAAVDAALADLEAACGGRDAAAIARCDVAFHEAILAACGGEDFLPAWRGLCSQMVMAYSRLGSDREVYEEHLRIATALRSGTKRACLAALRANIR